MNFTSLTPGELLPGMIAWTHGMRVEITDAPTLQPHAGDRTYATTGIVLNRDEVSDRVVPYTFTAEHYVDGRWVRDGIHRWTFQGNDLARVPVETASITGDVR